MTLEGSIFVGITLIEAIADRLYCQLSLCWLSSMACTYDCKVVVCHRPTNASGCTKAHLKKMKTHVDGGARPWDGF